LNPCSNLTPTILPTGSCTIVATFSPTSTGGKSTILRITSNASNNPTLDIGLSGRGVTPLISTSPSSHNFGDVLVGGTSPAQEFTVSNTGTANLAVSSIGLTGGDSGMFSVATGGSNPCSSLTPTILPTGSCTIVTTFAPTSAGGKSTTLRIISNASNSPMLDVELSGTGSRNTAPVARDDSYIIIEDTGLPVPAPGVLTNDDDADGDPLTSILVSGVSHGTLFFNANGSFLYLPSHNFNGTDSFTYRAYDGTAYSNLATVTITVNPVNDPPVARDDSYSTNEDTGLSVAAPGVLTNDTDVDGDPLTAVWVSGPSHGSLTLNANGSFIYTPNANYNGTDSFTYKAYDGTAYSNLATVTITVNPVNDPPVARDDSYSTNEDTALSVAAPGVLTNDTDVDGDPLTAVWVSGPSHGSLTLNANGSFIYTPNANYNGTDSFTYRAYDGTAYSNLATVTITVNPVNDPPVAVDDSYVTLEDTVLNVGAPGVLGNDYDADNPVMVRLAAASGLTAILVSGPSHGTLTLNPDGSFTYTPDLDFNGTDSFTYKAYDGEAYSTVATVTITVAGVNDSPVARNDSYNTSEDTALSVSAPGVLGNDNDVDGDPLTAVLVSGPANATSFTLNPDGSFNYAPKANFNGADSFTYKAYDGSAYSNVATVTITVMAVDDSPVANNDSYSTNEDISLTVGAPGVLGNDTDVEGDALSAILVSNPLYGTLSLNADGSFTYMPNLNFNGNDSFSYKAFDGSAYSNVAMVTITVNPVNDPPVARDDSYSTNEDTGLSVAAPGVLTNDTDVDGDPLTAVWVSGPSHGSLTLNANGSFIYTPNANYNGADSFTYRAYDGTAYSNLATVTITVNPVNDAPVALDQSVTTIRTAPVATTLTATDVDGDSLTYVIVAGPSHGTLSGTAPNVTYTAASGYDGTDSLTFKANDGKVDSNIATVTITVKAPPLAPVLSSPSNGETGISINPTLVWNGSVGAPPHGLATPTSYRLQVSISETFSTTVFDESGITAKSRLVPGLFYNTTYFWRVNATNGDGTGDWSQVGSFTTVIAPPASPTLSSPSDGAIGISTNPTLYWNAASGAASYRLQVSLDPLWGTTVFDQSGMTGTSQVVSGLLTNTVYYWRVSTANPGGASAWSLVWHFTTICPLPGAFAYLLPPDGATNQPTGVDLDWGDSSGATSYDVYFGTNDPPPFVLNMTSTSYDPGMLVYGTTYFWKIVAKNGCGDTPGPGWKFSTIPAFTVTASVSGGHGSANPPAQTITLGGTATIVITPDPGYHIDSISDNGVSQTVANPYVISTISQNHDIVVTFYRAIASITNGLENTVSIIDIVTNTPLSKVLVESKPLGVALNGDGTALYITSYNTNDVSVIDTEGNNVITAIKVGKNPLGIAMDRTGSTAYVTNYGGKSLSIIDMATHTVVATVKVGTGPSGVVVSPDGQTAFVANYKRGSVSVIERTLVAKNSSSKYKATATVTMGSMSGPYGMAIHPSGTVLYVANYSEGTVAIINTSTRKVIGKIDVGPRPTGVAVNSAGTYVYVTDFDENTLTVIDATTNTVIKTVGVGSKPFGVSVNGDGTRVYVANSEDNTLSVIDTDTHEVSATIATGDRPVAFGSFVASSGGVGHFKKAVRPMVEAPAKGIAPASVKKSGGAPVHPPHQK